MNGTDTAACPVPNVDVPVSVLRTAWVALVPCMNHGLKACNGGPDGGGPWCFTCDAIEALQPFQHLWLGRPEDDDPMPDEGWSEGMTSEQLRARYDRPGPVITEGPTS